jgi:RteC protein
MIAGVASVYDSLLAELDKITLVPTSLERAALAGKETFDCMRKMTAFIAKYNFENLDEEVQFFKVDLPAIFSQYSFWSKVLDLEVRKKGKNFEMIAALLNDERSNIDQFYSGNQSFLKYYFEGLTMFDDQIFRKAGQGLWPFHNFTPQFNAPIPRASEIIGVHLAFEKYDHFLFEEEKALARKIVGENQPLLIELLISDAALVELVSPVHELDLIRINGKKPTQAELLDIIDKYLHRKIKDNFSTIDNKNRARKKGATPFLQQLLDAAVKRNDRLLK